jgi:hypothetical protein
MSIKKNLPVKPEARKLLQARVDPGLYNALRSKLGRESVEIREFFEAAIKSYLEEK